MKLHIVKMKPYFINMKLHFVKMKPYIVKIKPHFINMKLHFVKMKPHFINMKPYIINMKPHLPLVMWPSASPRNYSSRITGVAPISKRNTPPSAISLWSSQYRSRGTSLSQRRCT